MPNLLIEGIAFDESGVELAGVEPHLQGHDKPNASTGWRDVVIAEPTAGESDELGRPVGAFRIQLPGDFGYDYARLRFFTPDGRELPLVQSTPEATFACGSAPEVIQVVLDASSHVAAKDRRKRRKVPDRLEGTIVSGKAGQGRPGVAVRLYATEGKLEYLVDRAMTLDDGTFELHVIAVDSAERFRLELGDPNDPLMPAHPDRLTFTPDDWPEDLTFSAGPGAAAGGPAHQAIAAAYMVQGGPTFQRLEGVAVGRTLEDGLQARIADPNWFIARQWQAGEFRGELSASPVLITAKLGYSELDYYRGKYGQWQEKHDILQPLEVLVERDSARTGPGALRRSADAGLTFLRGLDLAALPQHKDAFRGAFPLVLPEDDGRSPRGRRLLELLAVRSLDGYALYDALIADEGAPDWNLLPSALASEATTLQPVFDAFTAWLVDHVREPDVGVPNTWQPEQMEHWFAMSGNTSQGRVGVVATEYPGGTMDWYAFEHDDGELDLSTLPAPLNPDGFDQVREHTLLPMPMQYPGMPSNSWWELEDRAVWWGAIEGGIEDLPRYLVASFASVFSDTWFLVPFRVAAGSLCGVIEMRVIDSFGREIPLTSLAAVDHLGASGGDRPWRFFELSKDPRPANGDSPLLLVAPALAGREEGPELERVDFVRDEAANLGWAVERYVEHPSGRRIDRQAAWEKQPATIAPIEGEKWRYRVMSPVPDFWVPLLPIRIDPPSFQIGLLRGRIPRAVTESGEVLSTGATARLLRPDETLILRENEIPRGGITVTRRYQYARGQDGRPHLWISNEKRPGRGPDESGLIFDTIERAPTDPPTS